MLGDENYPKESTEVLTGSKRGEVKDITFSESDGGATYQFNIQEVQTPSDITDEFVKTLGIANISTIEELRADIKKYLEKQRAEE